MKTLEFIYKDTEIHFLINPNDKNVMVNATEMAKPFNKRIDVFLKTQPTKMFIQMLEFPPTGVNLEPIPKQKIIHTNHRHGTFFHRELAIEFAMWLDPILKRWIINKIDEVLFGNYQKHWEAHAIQEQATLEMDQMKVKLLTNPTVEASRTYFEALERRNSAKHQKTKAIRDQLSLFSEKK